MNENRQTNPQFPERSLQKSTNSFDATVWLGAEWTTIIICFGQFTMSSTTGRHFSLSLNVVYRKFMRQTFHFIVENKLCEQDNRIYVEEYSNAPNVSIETIPNRQISETQRNASADAGKFDVNRNNWASNNIELDHSENWNVLQFADDVSQTPCKTGRRGGVGAGDMEG